MELNVNHVMQTARLVQEHRSLAPVVLLVNTSRALIALVQSVEMDFIPADPNVSLVTQIVRLVPPQLPLVSAVLLANTSPAPIPPVLPVEEATLPVD